MSTIETRYRRLFEAVNDAIFLGTITPQGLPGKFIDVNDSACTRLGYTREELLQMSPLDIDLHFDPVQIGRVIQRLLDQKKLLFETEHRTKDGRRILVEISSQLFEEDGQLMVLSIARDLTERKAAEAALLTQQEKWRALFEYAPDACYLHDLQGTFVEGNLAAEELIGYDRRELIGKSFVQLNLLDQESLVRAAARMAKNAKGEAPAPEEFVIHRKDGSKRTAEIRTYPVDVHGERLVLGIARDVSARKEAEEALRESEERFRSIIENSAAGYFFIDREGRFQRVNATWLRMHKFRSADEIIGRHFSVTQVEEEQNRAKEIVERSLAGESSAPGEFRRLCKDGSIGWHTFSVVPVWRGGVVVGLEGFLIDTSERRKAEQDYRTLFREMLDGFALHEVLCGADGRPVDYRFLAVNPAFERLTGLKAQNLVGKTVLEVMPGVERHWIQTYGKVALTGQPAFFENYTAELGKHFQVTAFRPAPNQFACMFVDITERKHREEALRESQQRLDLATSAAKLGIWDWDVRSNQLTWDDQMFRLYGVAEKPASCGIEFWKRTLDAEDRSRAWEALQAALGGEQQFDLEFRIRHPHGAVRHIHGKGFVLRDGDENPARMLGINYDITERKHLEDQLRQAQKMEAVGRLAGGVAHDFNNILAAMMLHLGLLIENPKLDPEIEAAVGELLKGAERASGLTRQLLMFSRRSVLEKKALDLNDLVTNLLKMLKRLIGEDIDLQFSPNVDLPLVEADPGMMEQMLLNLCVNARDAMPKGGKLSIGLQYIEVNQSTSESHPNARPGSFVCITVTDTGCGMDDATLERIFEPFFTTKAQGKGTGLGLATVHGIVGQHKGWVEVKSKVGQGTTFLVFLPASARKEVDLGVPSQSVAVQGDGTILLVEDETSLRMVTARALRRLGYEVIEAADGKEALRLWDEHRGKVDLLLSDMVMPEALTGLDVAERLRESKSNLKIIIASGYSAEKLNQSVAAEKRICHLQKPYSFQALSQAVSDCLNLK